MRRAPLRRSVNRSKENASLPAFYAFATWGLTRPAWCATLSELNTGDFTWFIPLAAFSFGSLSARVAVCCSVVPGRCPRFLLLRRGSRRPALLAAARLLASVLRGSTPTPLLGLRPMAGSHLLFLFVESAARRASVRRALLCPISLLFASVLFASRVRATEEKASVVLQFGELLCNSRYCDTLSHLR